MPEIMMAISGTPGLETKEGQTHFLPLSLSLRRAFKRLGNGIFGSISR